MFCFWIEYLSHLIYNSNVMWFFFVFFLIFGWYSVFIHLIKWQYNYKLLVFFCKWTNIHIQHIINSPLCISVTPNPSFHYAVLCNRVSQVSLKHVYLNVQPKEELDRIFKLPERDNWKFLVVKLPCVVV